MYDPENYEQRMIELANAAKNANHRFTLYTQAAQEMLDDLLANGSSMPVKKVEWYIQCIESHRSSARAALDMHGDLLKLLFIATTKVMQQKFGDH